MYRTLYYQNPWECEIQHQADVDIDDCLQDIADCGYRFRWAACQLDALGQCRTIRDVKESLRTLPRGLNETYGRLLASIAPSDVRLVQKILTWLAFSSIPLTLHQLWEALAIEEGCESIDEESRLRSPQDIITLGNSLITLASDGHVMLAHLSVRDYLVSTEIGQHEETSKFSLQPSLGHHSLARDCLTYLFFSHLSSGPSTTQEEYLSRLKQHPLLTYAARYWFYHVRSGQQNAELQSHINRFFSPGARQNFMSWVQVLNADTPFKWNIFPAHATSLYYAASLGLNEAVRVLLQSATLDDINAAGSRFGGTALHAAAIRGHIKIMKRLIAAGTDPGRADWDLVTPLHSAASRGSMDVIMLLLSHGAPADARDGMEGKTPAEWAQFSGHVSAAKAIEQGPTTAASMPEEGTDEAAPPAETSEVEIWQPGGGYFPDHYERRSGLNSSLVIGLTIGPDVLGLEKHQELVPLNRP